MSSRDRTTDRLMMLAGAIDAAPLCVFIADADMRYVAVNGYACELLGYTEDELLGMRVTDVATYDEAPREFETMKTSAYLRGTSRLRAKDGEELVFRYVAGEFVDGDRNLYVSIGEPVFGDD